MNSTSISVQNLVKEFQRKDNLLFRAVDDISFDVQRGQIFGLLGPNGAGKSTTIKVLTTLLLPSSGAIAVNGYNIATQANDVRNSICVVIQENAVDTYLTVKNNFLTFGKFHGLTKKETEMRMLRVAEIFGLVDSLNQRAMDLSGGMKRRLQVAKMFLVDKPIVFLDEATTGMDTFNKRTTIAAIKEESERGRTIVLTTHILDEAEELCDAIAIMNHGKIIANGTTEEVKAMGLKLFYLSLNLFEITNDLVDDLKYFHPLDLEIKSNTILLTLRDQEAALKILSTLYSKNMMFDFEMSSASLEDVFVALLDHQQQH